MPKIGARKRLLLFCASLAIALAGVQVHLIGPEGGMTAPIVSALISIALAGALVALAVIVPKAKQEAATKPFGVQHEAGPGPPVQDAEVLRDTQVEEYFAGIRGELGQVDRLVGDAVGNLVASFRYVSKLTRSQQEISLAIVRAAAPAGSESIGQLVNQQTAVAGQIEQELDAAVTSLQFGDLVAQLLGHTMIHIEALRTALRRIERHDIGQVDEGFPGKPRRVHDGVSRAVMAADTASRMKPVRQQGMQTGDIELF